MSSSTIARDQAERRRSPRKPHMIEAWISSPTRTRDTDRLEATAIDLSKHGVAFDTTVAIPIHTYYVIEIGFGDQRLCCEIRTVTCRPAGPKLFHIGAEFA
jgi:hypothetical protein